MKNWVKRAIRTFVQSAIGYAAIAVPTIDFTNTSAAKTTLIGVGVSAVAAGISAIMNAMDDWDKELDEMNENNKEE
jgi:predicted DNA repair protein MutK